MKRDPQSLLQAAQRWVGTPFCPNSAVRGAGVCCHRLMQQIYVESHWLPPFVVPIGDPGHARYSETSPMLDWLRGPGSVWFREANVDEDPLLPGDLLLLRVSHAPHHLALVLPEGRFVHVTSKQGVVIAPIVTRWLKYLDTAWRPREIA